MTIKQYTFSELNIELLYAILRLRQQVFVIEQQSIYDDIDNQDQNALHLCIHDKRAGQLTGYLRLQLDKANCSMKIQRVVIEKSQRGKGIAKMLMDAGIKQARVQKMSRVLLSAQSDAIGYYQQWGFEVFGGVYDDGGIDHIGMRLNLQSKTPSP